MARSGWPPDDSSRGRTTLDPAACRRTAAGSRGTARGACIRAPTDGGSRRSRSRPADASTGTPGPASRRPPGSPRSPARVPDRQHRLKAAPCGPCGRPWFPYRRSAGGEVPDAWAQIRRRRAGGGGHGDRPAPSGGGDSCGSGTGPLSSRWAITSARTWGGSTSSVRPDGQEHSPSVRRAVNDLSHDVLTLRKVVHHRRTARVGGSAASLVRDGHARMPLRRPLRSHVASKSALSARLSSLRLIRRTRVVAKTRPSARLTATEVDQTPPLGGRWAAIGVATSAAAAAIGQRAGACRATASHRRCRCSASLHWPIRARCCTVRSQPALRFPFGSRAILGCGVVGHPGLPCTVRRSISDDCATSGRCCGASECAPSPRRVYPGAPALPSACRRA